MAECFRRYFDNCHDQSADDGGPWHLSAIEDTDHIIIIHHYKDKMQRKQVRMSFLQQLCPEMCLTEFE